MQPYLSELNEKQREAVEATHGPVIVLAGAGSGKTKTLVSRVAHLIRLGVAPSSILAVTFTNKAANEMKLRVTRALQAGDSGSGSWERWAQPWMGFSGYTPEVSTFHSFCVKLLRQERLALGYEKPFVIYDDGDQNSLIKKIIDNQNISTKFGNARRYQGAINAAKCQALGPNELEKQPFSGPFGDYIVSVYSEYQRILSESGAMDFGDLIVKAYELLRDHPEILERYQEKFKFLMVDEYQDTNRAQYLLISLLAKKYKNLCVVGDEDQSIYGWRGADIRNILDFQSEYPDAKVIKLEQNYRSTKTIIEAASHVIRNNNSRYDKTLWTDNPQGEKINWVTVADERAEAEYVVREVESKLRRSGDLSYKDIAVFYRSHAQSRALEEALRRGKVPHEIIGGVGFYERREIKDLLAYLRVLVNPADSMSLERIINVPARGIGKTTVEKMEQVAREKGIPLFTALKTETGILSAAIQKKIAAFVLLIEQLSDTATRENVSEIYHRVLDSTGYVAELKAEDSEESKARIENLKELETVIQFFESEAERQESEAKLENFISQITLESAVLEKSVETGTGSISLMTMHSAKGLEFPLVYIIGCEEGIFPSKKAIDEADLENTAVEEERRICYVGITRAERELTLMTAQMRRIYGQIQMSAPSRFIAEIPDKYLNKIEEGGGFTARAQSWGVESRSVGVKAKSDFWQSANKTATRSSGSDRYDYSESQAAPSPLKSIESGASGGGSISVGQRVKHPSYGAGTVKSLEGSTSDRKVTIEFTGRVLRKFLLKHVELELL